MPGPAPLVLCGPSGAGKSTLLKKMMEKYKQHFGFSVSHTTRPARPREENGVAYNFVSKEDMQKAIANDEFIEHATFAGNMYGTSKAAVETVMERGGLFLLLQHFLSKTFSGLICILDIDVQGVISMKKTTFNSNYVFIMPPNTKVLEERLKGRGTETEDSLKKRLDLATRDMEYGQTEGNFDIIIVNDDLDVAYASLMEFLKEKYTEIQ